MASTTYLDGQTPVWRTPNGSQSITIDPTSQSITVENTTIPKKIIINPIELSNGTQVLPYTQLYEKINAVEACVFPAPSATQLQVENSILITDTQANQSLSLDFTGYGVPALTLLDGNTGISSVVKNNSFYINDSSISSTATYYANQISSGSNNFSVDTGLNNFKCGDVGFTNNGTLFELDDTSQTINLNTINFNTFNSTYALPICYTKKFSNNINYIGVNNTWQNVYHDTMALPNEFFNPSNTFWAYKIEFGINLRNMSSANDKGLALYFEFLDNVSNIMTPFMYNQSTPFTRHSNDSTYSATSSNMLTFNWNDYCDFSSSANNNPLTFSLWWYGDQNNAPDFEIVLSLTRTNLV